MFRQTLYKWTLPPIEKAGDYLVRARVAPDVTGFSQVAALAFTVFVTVP